MSTSSSESYAAAEKRKKVLSLPSSSLQAGEDGAELVHEACERVADKLNPASSGEVVAVIGEETLLLYEGEDDDLAFPFLSSVLAGAGATAAAAVGAVVAVTGAETLASTAASSSLLGFTSATSVFSS